MQNSRIKSFLLHCGIGAEDFDAIRGLLWDRNIRTMKITALLSGGIGALFLVVHLLMQSGVWRPYAFLFGGSALTLLLLTVLQRSAGVREGARILVCYAHMVLVCVYAGLLSTQPSNYATPATSVIVFIALLPLCIDDRPIRMYAAMLCETAAYLAVSHCLKSAAAFSLDLLNAVTFCAVGMVLYGVICVRNVLEIHQSDRVEKIQKRIISSLAAVVEERDESTGDHIRRTETHVERLLGRMRKDARYAALTKEYCGNIILAAPLHDIGKIKVPDAILNKPGRLTPEEYAVMKTHAALGGEIIRKTMSGVEEQAYCDVAANIAQYHHERYDGTGYPEGLKGEAIPLEARIMALADVYDALVSERVYKKAYSKEEAKKILLEGSGTQFDPALVPIFLACVK